MGDVATQRRELIERVETLLEGSLGLNVIPPLPFVSGRALRIRLPRSPAAGGITMALLYLLVWVVLPWIALRAFGNVPVAFWPLSILQCYGAFWSGWATMTTRAASAAVVGIVREEIVHNMSSSAMSDAETALGRPGFNPGRLREMAWAVGLAAGVAASFLVLRDVPEASAGPQAMLLWWGLGWALCYATAAKVVMVSRFYGIFALALAQEPQQLSALTPVQSPAVLGVLAAGKTVLTFWVGIAVSIVLILPFAVILWGWDNPIGGAAWTRAVTAGFDSLLVLHVEAGFVKAHIVLATLFAIGGGSFVFLKSEAAVRMAVRRAAGRAAEPLDLQARVLLAGRLGETQVKRLTELKALHDGILEKGAHRSVLLTAISVLLPFFPLITLLVNAVAGSS